MTTEAIATPTPVAAPAPAAPAAPVAEAPAAPLAIGDPAPAPAPAAEAPAAPAAEAPVVTYEPTGDPALDVALGFLGRMGIAPDHPGVKAAEAGDFAILKAELAALGDKAKGWEQFIALGEAAYAKVRDAHAARAAADREAVLSAVGGEENWKAVQDWATKNAEPAERDAVNAALAAGGIAAKAMATYLNGLYQKASGTTVTPAQVVPGTAASTAGVPTNGALSPKEYAAAVHQLYVDKRGSIDDTPEYAALQARRAAYRGR